MNYVAADLESIDFRLKSLQALEKKAQKSIAFIDRHDLANWRKVDRFYWKYCLSFIRCVAGKWKTTTRENYACIAHLHDVALRQALIRNVLKVRRSIIATEDHRMALREWDDLWKWL